MKKNKMPAYLTVYLTLVLGILVSFCLTLIEGVRLSAVRLETETAFDAAMDSIFAQYNRELYDSYNLFAIDSAYGANDMGIWKTEKELSDAFERNLDSSGGMNFFRKDFLGMQPGQLGITGVSCLSDGKGREFFLRAVDAAKADVGVTQIEDVMSWLQIIEENGLLSTDVEEQKEQVNAEIADLAKRIGKPLENKGERNYESPTIEVDRHIWSGLFNLVYEDADAISHKGILERDLAENRIKKGTVTMGNLLPEEDSGWMELVNRIIFSEYLFRYFYHYGKENPDNVLDYELEYLICGDDTDWYNLVGMMDRIYLIRQAANLLYILTDTEKKEAAKGIAEVASTATLVPEFEKLYEMAIILSWVSAESVADIRAIFRGGKVPLLKSKDTWVTSLTGMLAGLFDNGHAENESGLDYADYTRILLVLSCGDGQIMRAMNLIEANMRLKSGYSNFSMDACYTRVEAKGTIVSKYGYLEEITRQRSY